MKRVLWISLSAPYDSVAHAGGKTENYYVKGTKKNGVDMRILSFALEHERAKMDLEEYEIEYDIKFYPDDFPRQLKMMDIYRYSLQAVKKYKQEGYAPDVIVLQWTQMAFLIGIIKKVFPNAKYIVIEEDVTFLAYRRFYKYYKNPIKKLMFYLMYHVVKYLELKAVCMSDKTVCSNEKDKKLLWSTGIDKQKVINIVPYYQNMSEVEYKGTSKDIIFYGAMGRMENHMSAVWFLENVFPKLKDQRVRFLVIGGGPKDELRAYENERVKIMGYVDDLTPYFSSGLCLAAPLVLGAGIKVKILEAMSAGLPVITNAIGIEGINVVKGKDYLAATTAEEYVEAIERLLEEENLKYMLSDAAKKHLEQKFNLEENLKLFTELVEQI